ncbi:hypothetical protein B5P22_31335 [Pseudomonas tolaasii]|uniref:immunoglobulin-like domain-containing protein n=1 Tax=Pseudomonas tolaasii TaxID=29442 RepID=UPI0009B6AA2D|nr:immunoglobulin-like domain-containing protein [Pseudomonas tolaasii]ARB31600.1 hypothetical protein B5P22_31335 [Pseudomonas tolaasii]
MADRPRRRHRRQASSHTSQLPQNGQTITIEAGKTTGTVVFETPANDVYNNGSTVNTTITRAEGGNFENLATMWELACLRWHHFRKPGHQPGASDYDDDKTPTAFAIGVLEFNLDGRHRHRHQRRHQHQHQHQVLEVATFSLGRWIRRQVLEVAAFSFGDRPFMAPMVAPRAYGCSFGAL